MPPDEHRPEVGHSVMPSGCAPDTRQDAEADRLDLQPPHDLQEVARRSGQPVELGDGEAVAIPDVIERRLKLLTFCYRRNLLAENLVAPGCPEVAFLRLQTGDLAE